MRAFYRGYHAATGRRARQVRRLHIVREDGKFAGRQGLCGAVGWGVTHSPPVILSPMPTEPPAGLSWCRACVGHASDVVGQLDAFARIVAALGSLGDLPQLDETKLAAAIVQPDDAPPEGRCGRCQQTRPLWSFSWVPDGWAEFKEIQLCARCHSLSALEDEDGRLDSIPLLTAIGALR